MKLLFFFLLFTIYFTSNAQIPSYVPTNGLVGYWPFNGNANDESGNGNNGTVYGATLTSDRFGNVGKAFEFYSTSGVGGYIYAPNVLLGETFTISSKVFWYNLNSTNASTLVSNHDGNLGYELNIIYSVVREHYSDINNAHFSDSTIPYNEWHQITWVKSGSTSRIFLDNRLISTKYNINSISNSNVGLFFGRAGWGGNILKGKLDDIAIYNRALTQTEITQLYTSTSTSTTTPEDTTSNVGIGTSNPKRKLHINDVMRLEPRNTAPANPGEGDIYYDAILKKLRYYNGTNWISL
jgi:hypothetical protein